MSEYILEIIGWTATAIAVVGVVCNNHRYKACFVLWMISNTLSAGLHAHAGMIALATRDTLFFLLAIHGMACWARAQKGPKI